MILSYFWDLSHNIRTQYPFLRLSSLELSLFIFDWLSYAKSTHLENTSLRYISCQQLIQIKPPFYGVYLTHNTPHGGDIIIQIFRLSWRKYSYMTWPFMVELYSYQCLNTENSAWAIRTIPLKLQASPIVDTGI